MARTPPPNKSLAHAMWMCFCSRPMSRTSFLLALFAVLLAAGPAAAQRLKPAPDIATTPEEMQRYQQCLQLAEKKPEDGFEAAMQWRDTSGSNAAKQCVAVALFYL